MFRQVVSWIVSLFEPIFNLYDSFMLDSHISLLSFFAVLIVFRIILLYISYFKHVQEVQAYNEQLENKRRNKK